MQFPVPYCNFLGTILFFSALFSNTFHVKVIYQALQTYRIKGKASLNVIYYYQSARIAIAASLRTVYISYESLLHEQLSDYATPHGATTQKTDIYRPEHATLNVEY
jgi:hypothetical protein